VSITFLLTSVVEPNVLHIQQHRCVQTVVLLTNTITVTCFLLGKNLLLKYRMCLR
jgi:hypothetical protein